MNFKFFCFDSLATKQQFTPSRQSLIELFDMNEKIVNRDLALRLDKIKAMKELNKSNWKRWSPTSLIDQQHLFILLVGILWTKINVEKYDFYFDQWKQVSFTEAISSEFYPIHIQHFTLIVIFIYNTQIKNKSPSDLIEDIIHTYSTKLLLLLISKLIDFASPMAMPISSTQEMDELEKGIWNKNQKQLISLANIYIIIKWLLQRDKMPSMHSCPLQTLLTLETTREDMSKSCEDIFVCLENCIDHHKIDKISLLIHKKPLIFEWILRGISLLGSEFLASNRRFSKLDLKIEDPKFPINITPDVKIEYILDNSMAFSETEIFSRIWSELKASSQVREKNSRDFQRFSKIRLLRYINGLKLMN